VPGYVLDKKYVVVRVLGTGGMGVVVEVTHKRLGQRFAIKVLRPDLADSPEWRTRFEREARAAARLKSPHVVRIFDVDTDDSGNSYMVMELLEGFDLGRVLEGEMPPAHRIIGWMIQCCHALDEAHKRGIVHRDLKPENILLVGDEQALVAKIVDFGISKMVRSEGFGNFPTEPTLTVSEVVGTAWFMSPEQVSGSKDIDGRSDLWSLATILYFALARRLPFEARSAPEHILAVASKTPHPLEEARPDLPHALTGAIMRALERDPADRWATAADFANALRPFADAPVDARPAPPPGETVMMTRRLPQAAVRPSEHAPIDRGSPRALEAAPGPPHAAHRGAPIPQQPPPTFDPTGYDPSPAYDRASYGQGVPPAPMVPAFNGPASSRMPQASTIASGLVAVVVVVAAVIVAIMVGKTSPRPAPRPTAAAPLAAPAMRTTSATAPNATTGDAGTTR
jgi:serine/threonine-protein kinase